MPTVGLKIRAEGFTFDFKTQLGLWLQVAKKRLVKDAHAFEKQPENRQE